MKIVWNNGKDRPEPPEHREERASSRDSNRTPNPLSGSWIDDLIQQHEQDGGFNGLSGKGKPLTFNDDGSHESIMSGILKNANALPEWVALQKEIHQAIARALKEQDGGSSVDLRDINQKIKRYNQLCPTPLLHKPSVTLDNLRGQAARWE